MTQETSENNSGTEKSTMTDAETILKLIETADPADTAKLDEIDIAAHRFLYGSIRPIIEPHLLKNYTRSRDALKAIRPDGYSYIISINHDDPQVCTTIINNKPSWGVKLPTEELAELHAIIQAIAYERGQNDQSK